MRDYCVIERLIVLLNVILFCISLSIENADQDVNTAILYIMFIIAYFVSSRSCLTGASNLKRRASFFTNNTAAEIDLQQSSAEVVRLESIFEENMRLRQKLEQTNTAATANSVCKPPTSTTNLKHASKK